MKTTSALGKAYALFPAWIRGIILPERVDSNVFETEGWIYASAADDGLWKFAFELLHGWLNFFEDSRGVDEIWIVKEFPARVPAPSEMDFITECAVMG